MTTLRDSAHAHLTAWRPLASDQERRRQEYLAFLGEHTDAVSRDCHSGHLTASALVMSEDRGSVLLTLHPKVGRWLQLGGHIEPDDADVRSAAQREVREESGLTPSWISAWPIRLDRHGVPCGGRRSEHLDVQYLALVDPSAPIHLSAESLDLRWFALADLPEGIDRSVHDLITDALQVTQA